MVDSIANQANQKQENSLEEKLKNYMASKELPLFEEELYIDGLIHRYSARQNGKKSEWYIINEIEPNKFICIFSSWRKEAKYHWRSYAEGLVANEKFKMELIEDRILEEENKIEKEQQKRIKEFFPKCQPCISHPYLEKKRIKPHGIRIKGNSLIIPMFDIDNNLASLQYIYPNAKGGFEKRFKGGISTKGLFYTLGDFENQKKYIVAEGFATGASIYENTNKPVIIAFSADNCLTVQAFLDQRYQNKTGELATDNDEKGRKIAVQWEKHFNTKVYLPTKEGYDFNDLYNELPKEEVDKVFATKSIKALNIEELINEKVEPEKWLNSVICEGTFNIIFGSGGVGKSRFAYEMAMCLCAGEQFLYFKPHGKFKCLFVDGEMTAFEIKTRIQDLVDRHTEADFDESNFKIIKTMDILKQTDEQLDLFLEEHRERLNEAIKESDVIFLDNLGSLTTLTNGESYKPDEFAWIKMFSWIKKWRSEGKTFVLVMHTNKSGKLKGVGKIRDDADLVLEIKKPIDIDKTASLHIEVVYDKARKLPAYKQENFVAKLKPDRTEFCGWYNYKN